MLYFYDCQSTELHIGVGWGKGEPLWLKGYCDNKSAVGKSTKQTIIQHIKTYLWTPTQGERYNRCNVLQ